MHRAAASAPGSVANLGCLFDAAAAAVNLARDVVTIKEVAGGGIRVRARGGVPEGRENVAYAAARALLELVECSAGLEILVEKGVPVGAGLGSSGATAAATVVALNELLGVSATTGELIVAAGEGEALAAGSPHYDNVAASIVGGVVLVNPEDPRDFLKLEPPRDLALVLFLRERGGKRKTMEMRRVLPSQVPLEAVAKQAWAAARFVASLFLGDLRGLGYAFCEGGPVEQARGPLLPGYWEAKREALEAGALGFNLSGAGPSLIAVCKPEDAVEVARAVGNLLRRIGVAVDPVITTVDAVGAIAH